jgi:hypothetical protein
LSDTPQIPGPKPPTVTPEAVRTFLAMAGVVLLSVGAGLAWLPGGLMLGGALILGLAVAGTLRAPR